MPGLLTKSFVLAANLVKRNLIQPGPRALYNCSAKLLNDFTVVRAHHTGTFRSAKCMLEQMIFRLAKQKEHSRNDDTREFLANPQLLDKPESAQLFATATLRVTLIKVLL